MNFLNNKFALAFLMLEASGSYSHEHKKKTWKKKVGPKKNCVCLKKYIAQPRHNLKHVAKLLKHWTQLLLYSEDFKISTKCLAECLKVLASYFEGNVWLSFLVVEKHWEFLKAVSVKSMNTRLNLELLARLTFSTFYFEIFCSSWFFSFFLHFCLFVFFQIPIIKSEFRCFR